MDDTVLCTFYVDISSTGEFWAVRLSCLLAPEIFATFLGCFSMVDIFVWLVQFALYQVLLYLDRPTCRGIFVWYRLQ